MFFATAEGRALGTSRAISAMVHDLTEAPVEVVGFESLPVEQRPNLSFSGTDALLDLYRMAG
ncbi:MAG TPA: hypothetical protein VGP70_04010 [Actinomadura sp.]|jgi:hypothetical protein|nr:hypothetical protein [Actinomadura sp.]